nr:hypothetical protein [Tanacetum cinerariifolium]
MEVPSELSKVSMVTASLKKLKFHLAQFDSELKKRITPNARTEVPSELSKVSMVTASLKKLNIHLAQFDSELKKRITPNARTEEFFENNDLKDHLQDIDTTICKLKELIKSMREKYKEQNVNNDYCEIETKNVELENSVAKLLSKNERLYKETNHVKQVFEDQFNSIKKIRFHTKEQSDSLIDKINLKSAENEDLKAQIQDKIPKGHVFTEVGLKWKLTGKTFTIAGNSCPLTRITLANIVPPKKTTLDLVETQKPKLKVYNKKPKNVKNLGSSKNAKIVESKNANHSEPNRTWVSNATDIPSSCSLVMTVRFENDHIARIIGYGDYQLGNVTISRVYYTEGLGHNLFFVGVDLLTGSQDIILYTISLDDMLKTSSICLLSKASKTNAGYGTFALVFDALDRRQIKDVLSMSSREIVYKIMSWDPTLSFGFCVSTKSKVVFLGGTMLAKVILVKGHELPAIVKVLPAKSNALSKGCFALACSTIPRGI